MTGRTVFLAAALAALLGSPAHASGAPTGADGLWRTPYNNGVIEVSACGDALCGRIAGSDRLKAQPDQTDAHNEDPSLRSRLLKGLMIFSGLKGGPPTWRGGSVYNPEDGRTYHGSITLVGADALKLTGCVFYPLCRTQTWTRIK